MSLRRRIQTDVPETEVPDGCPRDGGFRRMSPRRRIPDVLETDDIPPRRMSPRRRFQTDVPRRRRMSLRRRIQTDVPETVDPEVPRDGGSRRMSRDGGSRRMSLRRRFQTDVPETDDPDGCL